jgi:hypothetical protein
MLSAITMYGVAALAGAELNSTTPDSYQHGLLYTRAHAVHTNTTAAAPNTATTPWGSYRHGVLCVNGTRATQPAAAVVEVAGTVEAASFRETMGPAVWWGSYRHGVLCANGAAATNIPASVPESTMAAVTAAAQPTAQPAAQQHTSWGSYRHGVLCANGAPPPQLDAASAAVSAPATDVVNAGSPPELASATLNAPPLTTVSSTASTGVATGAGAEPEIIQLARRIQRQVAEEEFLRKAANAAQPKRAYTIATATTRYTAYSAPKEGLGRPARATVPAPAPRTATTATAPVPSTSQSASSKATVTDHRRGLKQQQKRQQQSKPKALPPIKPKQRQQQSIATKPASQAEFSGLQLAGAVAAAATLALALIAAGCKLLAANAQASRARKRSSPIGYGQATYTPAPLSMVVADGVTSYTAGARQRVRRASAVALRRLSMGMGV